jgi:hypothetical protein
MLQEASEKMRKILREGTILTQTKLLSVIDFGANPSSFDSDDSELKELLELISKKVDLKKSALSITLLISDMTKFLDINKVYKEYFAIRPPVRVCVACPRPSLESPRVLMGVTSLSSIGYPVKNLHV